MEHDENKIAQAIEKLKKSKDISNSLDIVCKSIKSLVPSDKIYILSVDREKNTVSKIKTLSENDSKNYTLDQGGLLTQCYQSKHPLMVNSIERSLLYNPQVDTLDVKDIEKLLVVPVLDNSENKNVLGIVWIGIFKGYKQFIQQDIDETVMFFNASKEYIFLNNKSSSSEKDNSTSYEEYKKVMKVKMDREKDYFASTIHDIRTPMNAVIGFMELMLTNEEDDQKREYIEASLKSGEQMVSLINDALDMSKVSSGKMNINKKNFSPMEGLADIVKLFSNTMRQKNIEFETYIDPKLPALINSDLHRIKQIVNNLLSNALKFTPVDGKIILECLYSKEKDTLSISVKDTGIGIAKEKQKGIFSPYAQESSSTAKEYGGTGLGLAISQQLSILLNGTLVLESQQGVGSEFIFTFPCDTPDDMKQDISEESIFVNKVSIYVKDDEEDSNLGNARRYFDDFNIEYKNIYNLDYLDKDPYHLLLMFRKNAIGEVGTIKKFLHEGGRAIFIDNYSTDEKCRFDKNFKLLYHPVCPDVFFKAIDGLMNPDSVEEISKKNIFDNDRFKGKNILVIDDNIINLKLMNEILKKFSISVITDNHPKEAVKLLDNNKFDMIFIDQNMPIMQGDEFIKIVREKEKKNGEKNPTIIYSLTGDADESINKKIMDAGANGIYVKPVHLDEIHEALLTIP